MEQRLRLVLDESGLCPEHSLAGNADVHLELFIVFPRFLSYCLFLSLLKLGCGLLDGCGKLERERWPGILNHANALIVSTKVLVEPLNLPLLALDLLLSAAPFPTSSSRTQPDNAQLERPWLRRSHFPRWIALSVSLPE